MFGVNQARMQFINFLRLDALHCSTLKLFSTNAKNLYTWCLSAHSLPRQHSNISQQHPNSLVNIPTPGTVGMLVWCDDIDLIWMYSCHGEIEAPLFARLWVKRQKSKRKSENLVPLFASLFEALMKLVSFRHQSCNSPTTQNSTWSSTQNETVFLFPGLLLTSSEPASHRWQRLQFSLAWRFAKGVCKNTSSIETSVV
jgi:hypothetical protein